MLYSIVPPILVILSVIGIILFLMKKAPDVAVLEESEIPRDTNVLSNPGVALTGTADRSDDTSFKQRFFLILEKTTRKLRVLFLKLENVFTSWSESLKKKRNGSKNTTDAPETQEDEADILDKLKNFEVTESKASVEPIESNRQVENRPQVSRMKRPMVSIKAELPRPKTESKGHLELILIERIAANPRDVEAYERLGEYYMEMGNYTDAKECFKQVVKLDPSNYNVKMKMRKLERLLTRQ